MSPRWKPIAQTFAIGLLALLAYLPTLSNGFIWDDDDYVVNNLTLRSPDGLRRIWFELGATPQYYPLVFTTFWAQYQFTADDPFPFHAVNLALHITGAILAWRILRRLPLPGGDTAAWVVAAVFAVHPVHVESVAWITERKNTLMIALYLGAFLAYLRWNDAPADTSRRHGWYALSLVLFALAMLSKTVAASLPMALLLVLWWRDGRFTRNDVIGVIPFLTLGVPLGILTVFVERHYVKAVGFDWSLSFAERVLIAGRALWFYVAKLIAPIDLVFIYPRWEIDARDPKQYLFPLAAVGLVALCWAMRRRWGRGPLAGVLFFGGTLVPALGFFDIYPMRYSFVADHFQYHASLGILALLVGVAAEALSRMRQPFGKRIATVGAAAILLPLAVTTWRHCHNYRDLWTLWNHVIDRNPSAFIAWINRSAIHSEQGRLDEALADLQRAIDLNPRAHEAWSNIARIELHRGRLEQAEHAANKALDVLPTYIAAINVLGEVRLKQGKPADAEALHRRALSLRPADAEGLYRLTIALASQGKTDDSRKVFAKLLMMPVDDPRMDEAMGRMLMQTGRPADAVMNFRAALRREPTNPRVMQTLAWVLATSPDDTIRNGAEATELATRGVELTRGQSPEFLDTLAAAHAESGRFDEAVKQANRAAAIAESFASNSGDPATAQRAGALAAAIRQRVQHYMEGKPWREQSSR